VGRIGLEVPVPGASQINQVAGAAGKASGQVGGAAKDAAKGAKSTAKKSAKKVKKFFSRGLVPKKITTDFDFKVTVP
jgi:hypothetical protein